MTGQAFFQTESFKFKPADRAKLVEALGSPANVDYCISLIEVAAALYRESQPGKPLAPRRSQAVAAEIRGVDATLMKLYDQIDSLSSDALAEVPWLKPHLTLEKLSDLRASVSRAAVTVESRNRVGPDEKIPERELARALADIWPGAPSTLTYARGSKFHDFALMVFRMVGAAPRTHDSSGNLENVLEPVVKRLKPTSDNQRHTLAK